MITRVIVFILEDPLYGVSHDVWECLIDTSRYSFKDLVRIRTLLNDPNRDVSRELTNTIEETLNDTMNFKEIW